MSKKTKSATNPTRKSNTQSLFVRNGGILWGRQRVGVCEAAYDSSVKEGRRWKEKGKHFLSGLYTALQTQQFL